MSAGRAVRAISLKPKCVRFRSWVRHSGILNSAMDENDSEVWLTVYQPQNRIAADVQILQIVAKLYILGHLRNV